MLQNANAELEQFEMCIMQHRLAELMSHPGEGNLHHVDLCHSITWSILHISVQVRKQKLPAGRPCQEPRECPGWEE